MGFTFGCAKPLYEAQVHPRVLIGPRDLEAIRRRSRSGNGRRILESLRAWVGPRVDALLSASDAQAVRAVIHGATFGVPVYFSLDEVAMLGRIGGDARAIEAARRTLLALADTDREAAEFPNAYGGLRHIACAYDALATEIPESDRRTIADWIVDSGIRQTLAKRPGYFMGSGHNMVLTGTTSALLNLLAVEGDPGVPDLAQEREQLLQRLEATLHTAIGPEGYPVEDIGYGTGVAAYLAYAVDALRRAGLYDVYRRCPRYARLGQAILHFLQPWGLSLTNTGDGSDTFHDRQFVLARLARETRDRSLLWLLGVLDDRVSAMGEEGRHRTVPANLVLGGRLRGFRIPDSWTSLAVLDLLSPPRHPSRARLPTAFRDRTRGIVTFRSGWARDDTLVVFDASQRSPSVQGHDHDSSGHFGLSALGEYFAVDTGRYNGEQDQHNVVLVDGRSGYSTDGQWGNSFRHGILLDYRPGRFVDFAAADSSHQANCLWSRRYLGLVKGRAAPAYVWTAEDVNKANDYREFWWTLNTSPGNRIETDGGRATVHGCRRGNHLDVYFVLPNPEAFPKPHQLLLEQDVKRVGAYRYISEDTFRSRMEHYRGCEKDLVHTSVFERPRLLARVSGYNGRFLSILIPRREGAEPAVVERLEALDNVLAARITLSQVEDILIWSYEHHLLEAADVRGRGQWVVVRRARRSGRVLAWEMGDGSSLEVGGRRLAFSDGNADTHFHR